MKVHLINATHDADELCDSIAGICYGGDISKASKDCKRLRAVIESGHTSVLEHASYTFYIEGASRILLAELTRHRIASYTVRSTRYCDVELCEGYPIAGLDSVDMDVKKEMFEFAGKSIEEYNNLVNKGVPREVARGILPMGIPTDIVVTMNARSLYNFFSLRMCHRAYSEIQRLAWDMYDLVKDEAPIIFSLKYCGPGCCRDKCREREPCGKPIR